MDELLIDSIIAHGLYSKSSKVPKKDRLEMIKQALIRADARSFASLESHQATSLEKHFKDKAEHIISQNHFDIESVDPNDEFASGTINSIQMKYLKTYQQWRKELDSSATANAEKKFVKEQVGIKGQTLLDLTGNKLISTVSHPGRAPFVKKEAAQSLGETDDDDVVVDTSPRETEKGDFESDTGKRKAHEDAEHFPQLKQKKKQRVQGIVDESSDIKETEVIARALAKESDNEVLVTKMLNKRMDQALDEAAILRTKVGAYEAKCKRKNARIRKLSAIIRDLERQAGRHFADDKFMRVTSDEEDM